METGPLVALGGVVAVLLVLLGGLLGAAAPGRRRTQQALDAARADVESLRARLEDLEASRPATTAPPVAPRAEYLITSAGPGDEDPGPARVPDRAVLSVTLGEPLVKAVALGYGLRRALSPDSRNRIAFAMRREVRRARKQRRRDTKVAVRETRRREAAA